MSDIPPQTEKSEAARREEEVLTFWKENDIFQKSLERGEEDKTFVFYEGPPTANGRPGVHHMESRSFKDAIPRYKTMQGFRVPRRAGWDTHGLPVELEVEKQLGFSGKPDIEKYGIAEFNKKCRESVFSYIDLWEKFTDRIGYWVDQDKAYFTFNAPYMESLFSIVKHIADDGRLYKDYKVLPWCPVCGTALSSHELAQGYEDVKDLSLTAKFELTSEPGTYFLAWTTTPWTLPGNVALAVGKDILYSYVTSEGSTYIVASALLEKVFEGKEHRVSKQVSGGELAGLEYRPLYPFAKELAPESEQGKFEKAFKVYEADFVTTESGTGIVHTAVMYGQEDFDLGVSVGLPKVHLVAPDATFIAGTGFLEGASVIDEQTNVAVLKDLQERNLFFSKESYLHTYPHCWRSKNRLIYYARDSWFVNMQSVKETLIKENQKVNWEPAHIRDGRMGEWLANVKDWAISRERYWGTPLPIWQSEDGLERVVIGSIEEMRTRIKKSGNSYFLIRHGESEGNAQGYYDSDGEEENGLTEKGKEQVSVAAEALKDSGISRIYASPLLRTQQTAELVATTLGISPEAIVYDERLREFNFGALSGKNTEGSKDSFWKWKEASKYTDPIPGGESYFSAKNRLGSFLYELEEKTKEEKILIVTHGIAFESAAVLMAGANAEEGAEILNSVIDTAQNAQVTELAFVPIPHNEHFELDLHRPYIDDVVLIGDSGNELRRVKEVMDVWFDSGSMPFAQDHYPFENKEWIDGDGFPADYISEAIDQTRGWFYTLLAVGVLMGKGVAYKNVICLGHLLDDKNQKMSKSKGNIIEPMQAIETYGADTLRLWMYSVNQPGDSKSFDDKTVKESVKVLSWFENSVKFYQLFSDGNTDTEDGEEQIIDVWMRTRLSETIDVATKAFDAYDLYTASRSISKLIEDLSQWYVRRVRGRVRDGDQTAITTLRDVIEAISILLAPLTPFISEWAYQIVRTEDDAESVHLTDWHTPGTVDTDLISAMASVRAFATIGLRKRQELNIKVRQPLRSFTATYAGVVPETWEQVQELLKDELNVKEILLTDSGKESDTFVCLDGTFDTTLTPELIEEGAKRALDRAIAEARKSLNLSPQDKAHHEFVDDGAFTADLPDGTKRFNLILDAT
jgi:isoleucyl-tRNA synthetase